MTILYHLAAMVRLGYLGALSPNLDDGVSRSMMDWLRAVQRRGLEVFIHSVIHSNSETCRFAARCADVAATRFEDRWMVDQGFAPAPFLLRFAISDLARGEVLGGHPEVVRTHLAWLAGVHDAYLLSCDWDLSSAMVRAVAGLRGGHIFRSPEATTFWRDRPERLRWLRQCDVFAISEAGRVRVEAELGISARRWPPYIEVTGPAPARDRTSVRRVGHYAAGPHKGNEIVLALAREFPGLQFAVMGRGWDAGSPQPPNIQAIGVVADPAEFLARVDLLVAPYLSFEGFGRVVIEAAAHGVPTIASRAGGLPEAVGDGGVLVDLVGDGPQAREALARDMAAELRNLLADEQRYRNLAAAALGRAADFDRTQEEELSSLLETIVGQRLPGTET